MKVDGRVTSNSMVQTSDKKTLRQTRSSKINLRCVTNFEDSITELERITKRTTGGSQTKAIETVNTILQEIEENGDQALLEYTKKFDGFTPEPLSISPDKLFANRFQVMNLFKACALSGIKSKYIFFDALS